ncbi:MAG: hypothetical protein WAU91_04535 [Desulfatitalea sp.]
MAYITGQGRELQENAHFAAGEGDTGQGQPHEHQRHDGQVGCC